MSELPIEPDPELNRRLVAKRLGWPDGAVEACREIEKEFPRWMVFWTRGGLPIVPEPGYRAKLNQHGWNAELFAPDAETLLGKLAVYDAEIPPPPGSGPSFPPLT